MTDFARIEEGLLRELQERFAFELNNNYTRFEVEQFITSYVRRVWADHWRLRVEHVDTGDENEVAFDVTAEDCQKIYQLKVTLGG